MLAGLAALGLGLSPRLRAQDTQDPHDAQDGQDLLFTTGVDVVSVLATVRDKQGRYVADLGQSEFELLEDGRAQAVKYFSRQTDIALTLGMLVDTSVSQKLVLEVEQNAGKSFFWQVLRPSTDAAFLIRFDVDVELSQNLTTSHQDLDKALDALDLPPAKTTRGTLAAKLGIGTALYDAVFLAGDEVMKRQMGRKAILVLSDGIDYGSLVSIEEAIEAVQKADTTVYSIHIYDGSVVRDAPPRGGLGIGFGRRRGGRGGRAPDRDAAAASLGAGVEALQRMAEETGGRYFEISEDRGLGDVYEEIDEELRNQYSLGYVSDNAARDGAFRKIDVRTKRDGLTVQARAGYYGPE